MTTTVPGHLQGELQVPRPVYRFFRTEHGRRGTILNRPTGAVWHATFDLKSGVCGAKLPNRTWNRTEGVYDDPTKPAMPTVGTLCRRCSRIMGAELTDAP